MNISNQPTKYTLRDGDNKDVGSQKKEIIVSISFVIRDIWTL